MSKVRAYLETHPNIAASLISLLAAFVVASTGADAEAVKEVLEAVLL